MPETVRRDLGDDYGERLLGLLGTAPRAVFDLVRRHGIDCDLQTAGTLHCAVGTAGVSELRERARQWRARGAPVDLLDAAQTSGRIGSTAFSASLLDRRAGTIQPLAYVRGLARAALGLGGAIFTASPVRGCSREGARWRVSTDAGSVTADWIVVATNAYTTAPWAEIREEIVHLPYFNIATRPLSSNLARSILPEREGCWDTRTVLSSFRLDRDGRLVIGSIGALRGAGSAIYRSWARRSLQRLFPAIGNVEFEHEWYGMIGMTADSLPRFHCLDQRVISFSGYNGRGIAPGTVFGRTLAQHILGQLSEAHLPLPVTRPRAVRFRSMREAGYEVGSQAAHLSARW